MKTKTTKPLATTIYSEVEVNGITKYISLVDNDICFYSEIMEFQRLEQIAKAKAKSYKEAFDSVEINISFDDLEKELIKQFTDNFW